MLNVFFVRPSDNGYYGIAEALLDQPRDDVRVRTSLFRSTQFPLTYPLPKRLDAQMQGWYGLQAYDLLVLAGVDPEVISPKEMRDIVAFVEHGGGLMLIGGAVSGSARIGTYEPLSAVNPVQFLPANDIDVQAKATASSEHPVTRGLPSFEGLVQSVHAVAPCPDANVLMKAGRHPLLVARERGKGRALFLNSYPQCAQSADRCFFADRFYGDLVRQAAQWLTRDDRKDGFTSVHAPKSVAPGGKVRLAAGVGLASPATLCAALKANGEILGSSSITLEKQGDTEFKLDVPAAADLPDTLRVDLEMRRAGGDLVAYRGFSVDVRLQVDVSLALAGGAAALAPGMPLIAHVAVTDRRRHKAALAFRAELIDPHGATLRTWRKLPQQGRPLRWRLGDLCSGRYTLRASVFDTAADKPLRTRDLTFDIVDPQDNEHDFPFATETFLSGGTVCVTESDARAMIDDVAEHGFNAVSLGGVSYGEQLTNAERIRRSGERHAQARGLRLVAGGSLVPSYSRGSPPDTCVLDPKFDRAVKDKMAPFLEQAARVPRLLMAEILDEPLIAPPMICRCPRCLAQYRQRYGYEMPNWEDTCEPGHESQRTDLMAFASNYWAEVFRKCYEFKQHSGAAFDVHHTFCQLTFGTFCSRYYWRDAFAWMPYCDRFDWDTYPYIYPIWRAHMELRCPNLRYHFAGHRSLARYFGKPMGHWLDLSDRNVPHWTPPVRASSELVYTAIGQDAKLVRTFWNLTFGRNNGVRRERWDDLGDELRKINRFSSLLSVMHKPHARLAMLFPATDLALRHHTSKKDMPPGTAESDFPYKWDEAPLDDKFPFAGTPYNAYELLLRAFGEADLLPEQMAARGELKRHRALAIWRARYLRRDVARKVIRFVKDGGVLLCDGIPDKDERGKQLGGFADLFGTEFRPICDDVAVANKEVGDGATLLFNTDVNTAYTDAVLSGDGRLRRALKGAIRDFLHSRGVAPHARPTNTEFEVDVLAGQDCFLLVVVNHNERDDETLVEVLDPPSGADFVADLTGGTDFTAELSGDFPKVRIALGERRGAILAIYPERPAHNAIGLAAESFVRGKVLSYEAAVINEAGRPAKGRHPVEIIVRDPAGTVRNRYGGRRATTAGVYRREVLLAANELPGRWEIELRDPITRTISRQIFAVT